MSRGAMSAASRWRRLVGVGLVLMASAVATGRAAPPDVESPDIVTCRLFVALGSTNPAIYREFRFWLEGLATGLASGRRTGFDAAAAMDRTIAACRAQPARLLSAVALEQIPGRAR